jgi:hypothetical protein
MSTGRIHTIEKRPAKMPIIGKIRVGEKRENGTSGNMYPVTLDYFKAVGDYAQRFHETFGPKPKNFGLVFINDDPAQSCNERYELRDKKNGNLIGSGDGLNFKIWDYEAKHYVDFVASDETEKKKLADYTKMWANGEHWRVTLTVDFVIPKIASVMGLWRFESKGIASTIPNIRDTFDEIKSMSGTVVNVPFDLQVKKVTNQTPGEKKLYPVVTLIPNVGADKIDEVNQFLAQGNQLRDIKRFLNGEPVNVENKNLSAGKETLRIGEKGSTVKAELFDSKQ